MIASKMCTNLTTTKSDIAARVYACGTQPRGGWRRERVEQRRGLLSERPLEGGPSRSHRGRAKKTPALPLGADRDPTRAARSARSEDPTLLTRSSVPPAHTPRMFLLRSLARRISALLTSRNEIARLLGVSRRRQT